jgi:hypothetical protein
MRIFADADSALAPAATSMSAFNFDRAVRRETALASGSGSVIIRLPPATIAAIDSGRRDHPGCL